MKTILLKLSGPLQSWGTSSHFNTRQTDRYPSKSAIIGLLAASFGYRRDQEEYLSFNDLDFAVRVDQQGNLLRDYHIAQKYKDNGNFDSNYVTNRYYLEDAVFVVGIGHSDESRMDEIAEALNSPYFQTFMGRRSLPLPVDFFLKTTERSVIDSLKTTTWQAGDWYQKQQRNQQAVTLPIYADADLVDGVESAVRQDRVISFSQKERKFGFRQEKRIEVVVENPRATKEIVTEEMFTDTDHDVFGAIGG